MTFFVNYDGPKLDKKQKQVVRSQVMVVVRGQQRKQAKSQSHLRVSVSSSGKRSRSGYTLHEWKHLTRRTNSRNRDHHVQAESTSVSAVLP